MSQDKIDPYSELEINKNASEEEIRKSYKRLAVKHHPDRNPNNLEEATTKFQHINKAFQILSNPESKKKYDQFGIIDGEEGQGNMPSGMNPFDIFANMFHGGMNMGGGNHVDQRKHMKSPDKNITININLSDLYNGKTIPIDFQRIIKCDHCDGSGAMNKDNIKSCATCGGKGKLVKMQQFGPMIQQSVQPCYQCHGNGKIIDKGCECKYCNGKKYIQQTRHVDCYVRPGSAVGSKISFKNESDWNPDFGEIGDLVVHINSRNEELGMKREGDNLIMKRSITLLEALTKTTLIFKHLDNRVIHVEYDGIIEPNKKMIIEGEGIPKFNEPMFKGDLIIIFDVIFPQSLEKERSKYLVKILPSPKKQIWDDIQCNENEIVHKELKAFTEPDAKHQNKNNNFMDDSTIDEEFGIPNAHPVECATQ